VTQKLFDLSPCIPSDTPEKVKYPVNVWPKGRLVEHVASPKYTHRTARKAKVFTGSINYLAIFLCFWGSISRANAHPHVFVETSTRIVFDDQRRIVAIQSAWTIDESY
jgi:hypothetical protein